MFPNLVDYDPVTEAKPENAGQHLGTLRYNFPDRVSKREFFADTKGCLDSAKREFDDLCGRGAKASLNESNRRFNKSMGSY
tara:strand:+ start:3737 stop:3979 length:243 start_codon:yes stop_codon:yes gene_type:complete